MLEVLEDANDRRIVSEENESRRELADKKTRHYKVIRKVLTEFQI